MSIETFGWITAGFLVVPSFLAGWFGREKWVQRRRDLPRAIFTPPAPRLQLVQPLPATPGRHHIEVVTTHAMPVVQEKTS